MGKETLTTRLDPDKKQLLHEYAEEMDIGQTEAARRLIRTGLEQQEKKQEPQRDHIQESLLNITTEAAFVMMFFGMIGTMAGLGINPTGWNLVGVSWSFGIAGLCVAIFAGGLFAYRESELEFGNLLDRGADRAQLGLQTILAAVTLVIATSLAIIIVDKFDSNLGTPSSASLSQAQQDVLGGFSTMTSLIGPLLLVAIAVVIIGLIQNVGGGDGGRR